ncbi:hypothetical protein ACTD5D_40770 [Nocardia takedensis]|uniref:hypothetical protein n=1 Tax=Nocardia takedensis TaxID=259390 RepID=UPI003F75CF42
MSTNAVQELIADGETRAQKAPAAVDGLRRLATAIDRRWEFDGEPAVAVGGIIHHTALLWRDTPRIRPVPGTLRRLEREMAGMWHCAIAAVFEIDGNPLRVGSVQLSPFDQTWATQDASRLLRVFNSDEIPGLLGGDFNGIGATEPDPYTGIAWHPDHAYQLHVSGQADRRAAYRLEKVGRMRDCALLAATPLEPTTGFHPQDHHPARRIDRWYATYHLPDAAITGFRTAPVDELELAPDQWLTDHRPIEVSIDLSRWPHRTP